MIRIVEARSRALEREHNDRAWLAWHVVALGRLERLPPLERLQAKRAPAPAPRQSWQQQLAIARQWDAVVNRRQTPRRAS